MKTLQDIVEICKSGKIPHIDDARLAVCVLDSLLTFETMRLMRNAKKSDSDWKDYEEHFNRCKVAFSKSPIEYIGNEFNPDNNDVQDRRKISHKIMKKILTT